MLSQAEEKERKRERVRERGWRERERGRVRGNWRIEREKRGGGRESQRERERESRKPQGLCSLPPNKMGCWCFGMIHYINLTDAIRSEWFALMLKTLNIQFYFHVTIL